jgi:hypothetical protein
VCDNAGICVRAAHDELADNRPKTKDRREGGPGSILSQNVNLAKLFLNLFDTPSAAGICSPPASARDGRPAILLGTIAMSEPGKHSPNDLSFSVKIQTKSVVEILILAIPFTGPHFHFAFSQIVPQPGRARNLNLCFSCVALSGEWQIE